MDTSEFDILNTKIESVIDTISRLEKSQEKMVEVMISLGRIQEIQIHLTKTLDDHIAESNHVRDGIFGRLRIVEDHRPCKELEDKISARIDKIEEKSSDNVWDFVKLLAAGAIGGLVGWWTNK